MKITRTSELSGIERTREINITQDQLDLWNSGQLIQRAMPNISDDDREFIMTGTTQDEWNKAFCEEELYSSNEDKEEEPF